MFTCSTSCYPSVMYWVAWYKTLRCLFWMLTQCTVSYLTVIHWVVWHRNLVMRCVCVLFLCTVVSCIVRHYQCVLNIEYIHHWIIYWWSLNWMPTLLHCLLSCCIVWGCMTHHIFVAYSVALLGMVNEYWIANYYLTVTYRVVWHIRFCKVVCCIARHDQYWTATLLFYCNGKGCMAHHVFGMWCVLLLVMISIE